MAKETRPKISVKSKPRDQKQKNIAEKKSISQTQVEIDLDEKIVNNKDAQNNVKREKININIDKNFEVKKVNFDPAKVKKSLQTQFLVIFLSGSLLIWLNLFPAIIQIALSALLMFIFVAMNFKNTKSIPTVRGVFADSVYYLGFLFTFVALVVAMMELTKDGFDIESIVGSMGPALITTVIGMAFRIYFTQFDPITDEPETERVNTLGSLSSNLITAMENLERSTDRNNQAFITFQETLNGQMLQFTKKLEEIDFSNVSSQLEKFSKSINDISVTGNNLKETANRSAIVIENAKGKLENLDSNIDNANSKLKDINNLKSDITELNQKIDVSKTDITSAVDKAKESLKNVSLKMENNVSAAAQEINLSATKITTQLLEAENQAAEFSGSLKRALNDVVDFLNRHKL
jgi:methyl-accepting chemotaxis protein